MKNPEQFYARNIQADSTQPAEIVPLVAVLQRPGQRCWAVYDASLLADPAGQRRDPDVYLSERLAQGDRRILELPNSIVWAPDDSNAWRPVAVTTDDKGRSISRYVDWSCDPQGRWTFKVKT